MGWPVLRRAQTGPPGQLSHKRDARSNGGAAAYCRSRLILTRESGADMMKLMRRFSMAKMTLAILRCLA